MKFKIPLEGGDDEIDMAPMIDMVFLLLIFFMVASHLTALERIPVKLPVAEASKVPEATQDRQMISIRATGDGNEKAMIFMNLQEVEIEEFTVEIANLYEADSDLQVYLRADRNVQHKHIKAIMQACADVGIVDIIFGTFESGN